MSLTGAILGACILTINTVLPATAEQHIATTSNPVSDPVSDPVSTPLNALCFDLLCVYLIALGDTERGYHNHEPDRGLHASISERVC